MRTVIDSARKHLLSRRRALTDRACAGEAGQGDRVGLELAELDAALERIDAAVFGWGEACRGPIRRQRLAAVPEARQCLACREPAAPAT